MYYINSYRKFDRIIIKCNISQYVEKRKQKGFIGKIQILKNIAVKTRLPWLGQYWSTRHDDSKMFSEQRHKTLTHHNTTEQILKHQNKNSKCLNFGPVYQPTENNLGKNQLDTSSH